MTLMKQTVTLEIVYDSKWTYPPTSWDWDWDQFVDIEGGESVKILDSTTPERISDES